MEDYGIFCPIEEEKKKKMEAQQDSLRSTVLSMERLHTICFPFPTILYVPPPFADSTFSHPHGKCYSNPPADETKSAAKKRQITQSFVKCLCTCAAAFGRSRRT